jgi:hypothetical protein
LKCFHLDLLDLSKFEMPVAIFDSNADGGGEKPKLAVGGFSQGCATALYITACSVIGKYGGNGKPFPVKLDAAIGLSGWMPTIKYAHCTIFLGSFYEL